VEYVAQVCFLLGKVKEEGGTIEINDIITSRLTNKFFNQGKDIPHDIIKDIMETTAQVPF
jgi:hypothetical protein